MITNKEVLCQFTQTVNTCFFPEQADPSQLLFFDIETTGLSPRTSRVFLIGLLSLEPDGTPGELIQLLSESSKEEDEIQLLQEFSRLLDRKKYLVHFNGSSFDLPYLVYRYRHYGLASPFDSLSQVDLYRKLLGFPGFFRQMPGHSQKAFEHLVQYPRKDTLSGKEMINIYQDYLKSPNEETLKLLFLHNKEDLTGMLSLLSLGSIQGLLSGNFSLKQTEEVLERSNRGILERKILFHLITPFSFPCPLSAHSSFGYITADQNLVKIKVPLYEGTLKYFYPDYKNYYYLPYEDEAVHKSIGQYTEPSRRQKAKASNCYKKYSGLFLPSPESSELPLLRETYGKPPAYVSWPFKSVSPSGLSLYLQKLLKAAVTEK